MQRQLDLTFGIKLECVVSFYPADYEAGLSSAANILWQNETPSPNPREDRLRILLRRHVVELFRNKGYPTYDLTSPGGDQMWTVTNNPSIQVNNLAENGFLECDVEIISPALHLCPKALGRVRDVVRLFIDEFDVSVNDSCGLHVHVGNKKRGFPLQTLKHFSILTAMFEHQLNSLHPDHRIGIRHAKGPSAVFMGHNPWDAVRTIQRCGTKEQLVVLYANEAGYADGSFAYNLCPIVSKPQKTIEFRQHKGTLDEREIMNWIQVAGGLVAAMHEIGPSDLARLISTCAFDPGFSVCDLFLRLKMEALIPYYTGRLHMHLRPEPLWVPARMEASARGVPGRTSAQERWDGLVERQKGERAKELERLEELDKRHALERRRELERRKREVDAPRGIQRQREENAGMTESV